MKNNDGNKSEEQKKEDTQIEEHDFDGIKEKNNPIPWWFNVILYGSIIFAIIYFAYYHIAQDGQSLHNEEAASMGKTTNTNSSEFNFEVASKDSKILADAKTTFDTNCASCHGMHGEGGVGPNLTAGTWTHGSSYKDLVQVITEGVMNKGMPAWGGILGANKVNELVAYIASIQGTNPPNAKAPEGTPGKLH